MTATRTNREYTFDPANYPVTPGAILCDPHGFAQARPVAQEDADPEGAKRKAAADTWVREVVQGGQS